MRVRLGTSGYAYKEWKGEGKFYPADLSEKKMLGFYAGRFDTVEINNTFYQMPKEATLAGQAAQVGEGFSFAFKAPGQVTHRKRLKEVGEPVAYMWKVLATLGERLGPVLYGLPPNMKKDVARLATVLQMTPAGRRVAVEFRHESWFDDEVYACLREAGAALCIADSEEHETPWVATTDWGYLRLRRCDYDGAGLSKWAERVRGESAWAGKDVVVYFKHEDEGTAPLLAEKMRELLK